MMSGFVADLSGSVIGGRSWLRGPSDGSPSGRPRSRRAIAGTRPEVLPITGEPDDRLQVIRPVAGVIATAAEDHAVNAAPASSSAIAKVRERVRELDLAAPARGRVAQDVEHRG